MFDADTPLEEEQKPYIGARLAPWLVLIGLLLLFVPLYLVSATVDDASAPLATELVSLQATITAPPPIPVAEQTLTTTLLSLRGQLASVENVPPTLIAAHIDWPAIMSALHSYDANQITLTLFDNETGHLTLEGYALEESAVLAYASALDQTGFFAGVRVQSIALNPVAPATPDLQATPSHSVTPLAQPYMPFIFTLSVDLPGVNNGSQ